MACAQRQNSGNNIWAQHLHNFILNKRQIRLGIGNNFAVLCYVDDLIVIGEEVASNKFIKQLSNIFDLKHVSVLSTTQPLIFLGKKFVKNNDNSISISLSKEYYNKLLQPFGLNSEHSNSLSTTLSKRPPLDSTTPLTKEQHHQHRQSVGQLLWLSLVRPDLQHAARDLSKHLVAPTQLDLQQFICVLNLLQASIFLFNQVNASLCSSNATATPTGQATSTQGSQHRDLW